MKEATGNLWEYPADIRVITTNGVCNRHGHLVMGRGCALEAKQKHPGLPATLGLWVSQMGNVPYYSEAFGLVTLPTKNHWKDDSDVELIKRGLVSILGIIGDKKMRVVMGRPGCGNGNLSWDDVKPVCEELLDDRFTVISPV